MTRSLLRFLNAPLLVLLVAIGIALQSSLFVTWPLPYLQPDIVLLVVLWCALNRGFTEGGVITLIIAEIAEAHSGAPRGLFLICYIAVYLSVRAAARFIVVPSRVSLSVIAVISAVFWKLCTILVLSLLGTSFYQLKHSLTFLAVGAAVEGLFSLPVFKWLDRYDWITFKNNRAEHLTEEPFQLDAEGL